MDYTNLLRDPNRVSDEDVRCFRQEVFGDGIISRKEAEALFAMNASVTDTCEDWNIFFVEAMVDYCVNQAEPHGYVSGENAAWLMQQIAADGTVKSNSELEVLVKVIERAREVPESLALYALQQVSDAILQGNGKLLNNEKLVAGVIGAHEARMVRRLVYGMGSDGRVSVNPAEVGMLFELNDKTVEAENHPEWSDVFVKAVAFHLMAVSGYQVSDRAEAMRREAWLDDEDGDVAGMLSNTLSSVAELFRASTFRGVFDSPGDAMQEAWQSRNQQHETQMKQSGPVDADEVSWLVERMGRDGRLHANEKALLKFLKKESPALHPSLKPLLDKVA